MKLLNNSIHYAYLILVTFFFFAVQAHATDNKILLLGDSLSAGYGIAQKNAWVNLLQKNNSPYYHITNASISGETTTGALARLPNLLRNNEYDWIIIELGGNDGLQGKSIKTLKSNLEQLISLSKKANIKPILFAMQIPPNYGKRYTQMFIDSYHQVAEQTNTPLVPFFIANVATDKALMQKDGIHPNKQAQPLIAQTVDKALRELLANK